MSVFVSQVAPCSRDRDGEELPPLVLVPALVVCWSGVLSKVLEGCLLRESVDAHFLEESELRYHLARVANAHLGFRECAKMSLHGGSVFSRLSKRSAIR